MPVPGWTRCRSTGLLKPPRQVRAAARLSSMLCCGARSCASQEDMIAGCGRSCKVRAWAAPCTAVSLKHSIPQESVSWSLLGPTNMSHCSGALKPLTPLADWTPSKASNIDWNETKLERLVGAMRRERQNREHGRQDSRKRVWTQTESQ